MKNELASLCLVKFAKNGNNMLSHVSKVYWKQANSR